MAKTFKMDNIGHTTFELENTSTYFSIFLHVMFRINLN